jgi:hypothetical protein
MPIFFIKKNADEKWKNKLKDIFPIPTIKEIEATFAQLNEAGHKPVIPKHWRNFEYYKEMRLYGSSSNYKKEKNVLEIVEKKGVVYFALCDSKKIVKYKR